MDEFQKIDIEIAIKQTKEMMPYFGELANAAAQQLRLFYDALILKGFTEQQALKIVIAQGISPGTYNGKLD